jgi:hypothetical protein
MSELVLRGITIFVGRFGSGQTEAAINYALSLANGWEVPVGRSESRILRFGQPEGRRPGGVILIDLDLVTPYFRSREMADAVRKEGVEVIAPAAVGQHLDTPAITPQILGAIQQRDRLVVLDVGGDRQGARALGQFSSAIRERGYTMHFVVNPYRPFTATEEGLARSIAEIEASARLEVTSLVSNPNLMGETTAQQIVEGHAQIEAFAQALGRPIAFVCLEQEWVTTFAGGTAGADSPENGPFAQPVLPLARHFVMSWE